MSITIKPWANARAARADREASSSKWTPYALAGPVNAIFAIVAALMMATAIGFLLYGYTHQNQIYEGVTVAGIELGGMTRTEATAILSEQLEIYQQQPVLLQADGTDYLLDPLASGLALDLEATVDTAFAYGRTGSLWSRTQAWANGLFKGESVTPIVAIDDGRLDATLASIAADVVRPPVNAALAFGGDGATQITPELPGVGFDVATTKTRLVQRMLTLSDGPVALATTAIPAAVVIEDLQPGSEAARAALATSFVVSGFDQLWGIAQSDLEKIITVNPGEAGITIDREPLTLFVESVAKNVNRSAADATIQVDSSGEVVPVASETGITVDTTATVDIMERALQSGYHRVELVYTSQEPQISTEVAAEAAAFAEAMLDRGVTVTWKDGFASLSRSDLLAALTFTVDPDADKPFSFDLDRETIAAALGPRIYEAETPVLEPRLRLENGEIVVGQTGKAGALIDEDQTVSRVIEAALEGDGKAEVVIQKVEPSLSLPVISAISLDDVLAQASTYYGDSSDARRQNVEQASVLQNGWLVAPGEAFSFVENVGLITEENGFVTGFGIVDDPNGDGVTTAPVIGGGICQVSTTIFQAGFWAGLQVNERYSHPYWIQSYGEPPRGMKGLDAMVNIEAYGSLDLRFTNTTGNWIAIVVEADGTTVTATVYGTDPGWTINVAQPVVSNVIKPDTKTVYTESPELPKGDQLQVEYAQDGFTTEIVRTVTDSDGAIIDQYSLVSTYAPSRNTILRGTGPTE